MSRADLINLFDPFVILKSILNCTVTYPTEFVKTRAQFAVASGSKPPGPIEIVKTTLAENGIKGLYSGCSALVAGNAVKAGVRFLSYDSIKLAVADKEVRRVMTGADQSRQFAEFFFH